MAVVSWQAVAALVLLRKRPSFLRRGRKGYGPAAPLAPCAARPAAMKLRVTAEM